MNAQEFVLEGLDTVVPVHRDRVRLLRGNDPKGYASRAVSANDEGGTPVCAHAPNLLERYREDPFSMRQEIERRVHRARNQEIHAFFARLLRCIGATLVRTGGDE